MVRFYKFGPSYIQWLFVVVFVICSFSGRLILQNRSSLVVENSHLTTEAAFLRNGIARKFVTKSLLELGKMDEFNRHLLLFCWGPKNGAELLVYLLQKLQGVNSYRHVRLKTKKIESLLDQEQFVYDVYDTVKHRAIPLSFDQQIKFIDFSKFDKQMPSLVSLVRSPNNRLNGIFDQQSQVIPFFCGYDKRCLLKPNWALKQAKKNVEKYFFVVGILEEFNTTLEVLEKRVPYFFRGAKQFYQSHLGLFIGRTKPSPKASFNKKINLKELEFYDWLKSRLFKQLN